MEQYKTNPWMISTLVLAGLIAGYGIAQIPALSGLSREQQAAAIKEETASQRPSVPASAAKLPAKILSVEQINALPDDDPILGEKDAPITLVEFSDFQCEFCGRFFKNSLPQIEENYIKTGKVKLVYRDFPLDRHPQAEPAAEAAECADKLGRFRAMHDLLFSEQAVWSGNLDAKNLFKGYAKKIGLDSAKFSECLDKNEFASEIRKDIIDGATVGVSGTPAFFVNGKFISGALPFDLVFQPVFEAELDGKKWELQFDVLGKPSVKVE